MISYPGQGALEAMILDQRIGLTAALAATSISPGGVPTPGPQGFSLFEISQYLIITTAGTAGTFQPQFQYTDFDTNTVETISGPAVTNTAIGNQGTTGPVMVRAKAGTQINVQTTAAGVTGAPVYNMYTLVKQVS